jgi:DNA-binding CsgD family transcriptional regulator
MHTPSSAGRPIFAGATPTNGTRELLQALFSSSMFGVAICDRQFRFCAVNDTLAAMNGLPAEAHLGKTIRAVLGKASGKLVPVFRRVLATGQPVSNFELAAALPKRSDPGHWIAHYLPLRNSAGEVHEVGAVVLELTKQSAMEARLVRMTDRLLRTRAALHASRERLWANRLVRKGLSSEDPLAPSCEMIERCIAEALAMSRLLSSSAPSIAKTVLLPTVTAHMGPNSGSARQTSVATLDQAPQNSLSGREREVAVRLASGKTNKQIASEFSISIRTVETYRNRIMLKLGLHSPSELALYAIRHGLVNA